MKATAVTFWRCSKCGHAYPDEAVAGRCCVCPDCGKDSNPRWGFGGKCAACQHKHECDVAAKRLAAAVEVPQAEYSGAVHCPGIGEEYWETFGDFLEYAYDNHDDEQPDRWPEWVFAAVKDPLPRMDASDIVENMLDVSFDFEIEPNGVKELQAALDVFYKANDHAWVWCDDFTKKIRVPTLAEVSCKL